MGRPKSAHSLERRSFVTNRSTPRKIDFAADPNRGVVDPKLTVCRYKPDEVTRYNAEVRLRARDRRKAEGEVRLHQGDSLGDRRSRLLHALGFGADRVSRVEKVRCYGCPFQPFHMRSLWELVGADGVHGQTPRLRHAIATSSRSASSATSKAKRSRSATNAAGDSTS